MKEFRKQLKKAFSGKDNQSTDIGRVIWAIGALVFFGLSVYSVARSPTHIFDAIAYGTAFGAIMAGGGIGLGMKAKTEPEPQETQVSVQVNDEDKK